MGMLLSNLQFIKVVLQKLLFSSICLFSSKSEFSITKVDLFVIMHQIFFSNFESVIVNGPSLSIVHSSKLQFSTWRLPLLNIAPLYPVDFFIFRFLMVMSVPVIWKISLYFASIVWPLPSIVMPSAETSMGISFPFSQKSSRTSLKITSELNSISPLLFSIKSLNSLKSIRFTL